MTTGQLHIGVALGHYFYRPAARPGQVAVVGSVVAWEWDTFRQTDTAYGQRTNNCHSHDFGQMLRNEQTVTG